MRENITLVAEVFVSLAGGLKGLDKYERGGGYLLSFNKEFALNINATLQLVYWFTKCTLFATRRRFSRKAGVSYYDFWVKFLVKRPAK